MRVSEEVTQFMSEYCGSGDRRENHVVPWASTATTAPMHTADEATFDIDVGHAPNDEDVDDVGLNQGAEFVAVGASHQVFGPTTFFIHKGVDLGDLEVDAGGFKDGVGASDLFVDPRSVAHR